MSASVEVRPAQLEATPGETIGVTVAVTNDTSSETQFQVRVVGSDAAWSGEPHLTPVLAPGSTATVDLALTLPLGFPGGDHLLGVEVVPLGPTGAPSPDQHTRRVHDLTVTVGSLSGLHAVMEPRNVVTRQRAKIMRSKASLRSGRAVRRARGGEATIHLRNRSFEPIAVELSASSPGDEVDVRFDRTHTVIEPGHVVPVRARLKGRRPLMGQQRRTPFTVTARGKGTPVHLEGSLQLPARLRPGALKGVGILTVFALWAGTLAVVFDRVGDDEPDQATAEQATAVDPDGAGAGANGESAGGSGGDVVSGSTMEASGRVTAREPDGVQVRLRSVSLVDELSQGTTFRAAMGSSTSPNVRLFGRRGGAIFNRITPAERTTVTDQDGRWGFGEISGPGFFELRFSKPGYATRAYVVEAPEDGSPITLDTDLEAGDGSISGVVRGPDGPLGGVDLTITDGTVTLTASTPTSGNVGAFTVDGLTTPGSYLITASRRGYGTGTQLVRLSGGQDATGVTIDMQTGVGAIVGNVRSTQGPLGDITVTATDGEIVRTTTTLTEGPVGTFSLPQLPSPGIYTLTVEGDGWMSQTRDVALTGGQANVGIEMTASTGIVYGRLLDTSGNPIGGAGITAISEDLTYKNTTAPDGTYELVGLEPGSYVIEFDRFEFHPGSALIALGPGSLREVNLSLTPRDSLEPDPDNSLTVTISAPEISEPLTVTVTDRESGLSAVASGTGTINAVFNNIPAGVRTLDVTGQGFQETTVSARVALRGANNTSVTLRPLVVVNLVARSAVDGTPIAGAQVEVTRTRPDCAPGSVAPGCGTPILATTDAQGRARLANDLPIQVTDGTYAVVVRQDDFVTLNESFTVTYEGNPTPTVPVTLDRLGRIVFDIVEPRATSGAFESQALTGYTVSLSPALGEPGDHTRVADDFPFLFAGVPFSPSVTTFTATLTLDGYNDLVIPNIAVPVNSTVTVARVMFPSPGSTSGRVVWEPRDGGQTPIGNASVRIDGTASFTRTELGPQPVPGTWFATTDAAGRFVFPDGQGPVFGDATVNVSHPDFVIRPFPDQPVGEDLGDLVLTPLPGEVVGSFQFTAAGGFGGRPPSEWPDPATVTIEVVAAPPGIDPASVSIPVAVTGSSPGFIGGNYGPAALEPGTYRIRASYDQEPGVPNGFTAAETTVVIAPNRLTVAPFLELREQGSITGQVRATVDPDSPGGVQAIDGLVVTLRDDEGEVVGQQTMTVDATFRFPNLDAGTYTVDGALDGWRQVLSVGPISVDVGQQAGGADVVMLELARISGVLRGESDGQGGTTALPGTPVTATQFDGSGNLVGTPATVLTGSDGSFVFRNLEGGLRTEVVASVATFEQRTIVLDSDDPGASFPSPTYGAQIGLGTIVLVKQRATITGTFQSDSLASGPPPGLTVRLRRVSDNATFPIPVDPTTGAFTIENLFPVPYVLEFDAPNHLADSRPVNAQAGETVPLGTIVVAQAFNTVSGSVALRVGTTTLPNGSLGCADGNVADPAPRPGCTVVSLFGPGATPIDQVVTDASGAFTFSDIPDGTYVLQATRAGYAPSGDFPAQALVLDQGATRVLGPVTLVASNRNVSVTVSSAVDGVLTSVGVTLTPDGAVAGNTAAGPVTATTNASGVASFTNVVPGTYTVTANGANAGGRGTLTSTWTLPIAESPVLTIPPFVYQEGRASGSVQVLGPDITSAAGAVVEIRSGSSTGAVVTTVDVGDGAPGSFNALVPPGTYVAVALPGTIPGSFAPGVSNSFTVTLGQTTAVTPAPLVVDQLAQITVTVVEDSTDLPVAGATVNGAPAGACGGPCTTDASGQRVLTVPAGEYTLSVPAGTGYTGVTGDPITVARGAVETEELRVGASGTIAITTNAASPWTVTFTATNGGATQSNVAGSGTTGSFPVATGTYTVAITSGAQTRSQTNVVVTRGATTNVSLTNFPT